MAAAAVSQIPQPPIPAAPVAAAMPASKDDSFGEEECTMDFGDEEDVSASTKRLSGSAAVSSSSYATLQQRHLLACQYPGGEDFGVYLNEDGDDDDARFLPPVSASDSSSLPNTTDHLRSTSAGSEQPTATRRFRKRYETPSVVTSPEVTERQSSASPPPLPPTNDSYIGRPPDTTSPTGGSGDYWSIIEAQQELVDSQRSPVMTSSYSSPQLSNFPHASEGAVANVGSSGTLDRQKSAKTIRDKFTRFLKLSSSSSPPPPTTKKPPPTTSARRSRSSNVVPETGTIHNFSFADSKMASEFLNRGREPDSAQLETRSDFGGGYPSSSLGRPGSTWWDVGTLSSARSVQMSDSSGSSIAGRTKDQKADKNRSPIPKFFRRNRRSQSVSDVNSANETSSALSNGSGSGQSSSGGFARSPTRPAFSGESDVPPALPPMRKPSRDKDASSTLSESAAEDGVSTGNRLKGMWKRLKDSGSGSNQTKGRAPSNSGEVPTLPRVEKVSTLRFSRTNDELSIKL